MTLRERCRREELIQMGSGQGRKTLSRLKETLIWGGGSHLKDLRRNGEVRCLEYLDLEREGSRKKREIKKGEKINY